MVGGITQAKPGCVLTWGHWGGRCAPRPLGVLNAIRKTKPGPTGCSAERSRRGRPGQLRWGLTPGGSEEGDCWNVKPQQKSWGRCVQRGGSGREDREVGAQCLPDCSGLEVRGRSGRCWGHSWGKWQAPGNCRPEGWQVRKEPIGAPRPHSCRDSQSCNHLLAKAGAAPPPAQAVSSSPLSAPAPPLSPEFPGAQRFPASPGLPRNHSGLLEAKGRGGHRCQPEKLQGHSSPCVRSGAQALGCLGTPSAPGALLCTQA